MYGKSQSQWMIERRSRESRPKDHDSFEFNLILQRQNSVQEPGGRDGPEHTACPKPKTFRSQYRTMDYHLTL
jgi:hypothetical protein